jgi:hypothetical protein
MTRSNRLLIGSAFATIVLVIVWLLSPLIAGNMVAVVIATFIVAVGVGAAWRVVLRGRSI